MSSRRTRRAFLRETAARGALLTAGGLALPPRALTAAQAQAPAKVALQPAIEPLVRLLEETPREKLLEEVGQQIRRGTRYENVLAALLLAGVRNVEPRPSVGFKFHAVLVVHSVHLARLAASEKDRWVPIFWALDYFKDCQAQDERERGWTMAPVAESGVPSRGNAQPAFIRAMEQWDEAAADSAIAGLVRAGQPEPIWELFYRFGARDLRSIGHKAIDVANSHRVLNVIGWQHAEPALRSLAYALLMHEEGNPAQRDAPADRPWRENQERAKKIPEGWQQGPPNPEVTRDLLAAIRNGSENDAADRVVQLLGRGAGAASVWDALFLAAGELLVRQPGIVALHAVTTTNAIHYAYRAAREDLTRRLLVLQNAAFLSLFREAMRERGTVRDFAVDRFEPLPTKSQGAEAIEEIFADAGRDPMVAAQKTLALLKSEDLLEPWKKKARELLVAKSSDVHDYKFGYASLEDAESITAAWRGRYLASALFRLQALSKRDNPLVERTRAALKG